MFAKMNLLALKLSFSGMRVLLSFGFIQITLSDKLFKSTKLVNDVWSELSVSTVYVNGMCHRCFKYSRSLACFAFFSYSELIENGL